MIRENVKIDGKKVIVNDIDYCTVNLKGAETLYLDNWDGSISLAKYVYANTVLDKEDKNCQIFLEFISFVNQMVWISSTEGLGSIGSDLAGGNQFEIICNLENGVEKLEPFLREAGLNFKLVARDKGEGKTVYCQIGNREVPFFINEFDAFYHTDLSVVVINKLLAEEHIQVVFTSHNTDIISNELLRPDCYFIRKRNLYWAFLVCSKFSTFVFVRILSGEILG